MSDVLEEAVPLEGPLVRVRMLMAYDGKPYRGFAHQPLVRTVAGDLREALQKMFGKEFDITCAGRTDAGVHAWGQVVHFDVDAATFEAVGTDKLQQSLNKMLSPSTVIRHVELSDFNFDARFSAKARSYRYTIFNSDIPSPFLMERTWWIPDQLDFDAMNRASKLIVGEHDFSAFCRRPNPEASLVRNVKSADWLETEQSMLRFDITANAFCHQMVRSLTGMCVAVGLRRNTLSDIEFLLEDTHRHNAPAIAPPHGLCLWEVLY